MNGHKATKAKTYIKMSSGSGSATVEAAIVMPVFLIAFFTLAYLIRIFFAYNTMQAALQNVARSIGSSSYFYYASGLKDYTDKLQDRANKANETLADQKDTIINTVTSFNELLSTSETTVTDSSGITQEGIQNLIDSAQNLQGSFEDSKELFQSIAEDPGAQIKLLLTVFAQNVTYEARNQLVRAIAGSMLDTELKRKFHKDVSDVYLDLGIKDGIQSINFSQTEVFGDKESLDIVIYYTVHVPAPFSLIPEMQLCNRVKVIAWTGGRGESVRVRPEIPEETENPDDSSIWVSMDKDQRYWDRGLEIERLEVDRIKKEASGEGLQCSATDPKYPKVDAIASSDLEVKLYDVFTLNPFMKTYVNNPNKIRSEINRHAKSLGSFDAQATLGVSENVQITRVVVIVMPSNAPADAIAQAERAKSDLAGGGVVVEIVTGHGEYVVQAESPSETEESLDE